MAAADPMVEEATIRATERSMMGVDKCQALTIIQTTISHYLKYIGLRHAPFRASIRAATRFHLGSIT